MDLEFMAKKVLFVFAGTGIKARMMSDFMEGETIAQGETFDNSVIRVYFNGCHDEHIGGRSLLQGYLNPDLDVVANKLLRSFSKTDKTVKLNVAVLKKEFGSSIVVEPEDGIEETEEIDDITLNGFSRGAVSTFAAARTLDSLNIPISLLAEDPVPGDTRTHTYKENSIYRKNLDLSSCSNIVRAEILLGTYSKHVVGWQNKWCRQMAPRFSPDTRSFIFMVPKGFHCEFNRRATAYTSLFLYNRGLTTTKLRWKEKEDRAYTIPKVEQQKFHFGVVGREQFLPSYKMSILQDLERKYNPTSSCPLNETSRFKFVQALLALHNATMEKQDFDVLATAVLEDSDKGKALREFIVELDSIFQYSQEQDALEKKHLLLMTALKRNIYHITTDFQKLITPTLRQKEEFAQEIQTLIQGSKEQLPPKVYHKLNDLTHSLLNENALTHSHLVSFINEEEGFYPNILTADQVALDDTVTNIQQLAQKLFHSSAKQRVLVFEQEKQALQRFVANASDLASIASFLPPKQLQEALHLVNDRVKSISDIHLLMKVLLNSPQRKILYNTFKMKLSDMKPSFNDVLELLEYLSEKQCLELCKILKISQLPNIDIKSELLKHRLTESKIGILQKELAPNSTSTSKKETREPASITKTGLSFLETKPKSQKYHSLTSQSKPEKLPEQERFKPNH